MHSRYTEEVGGERAGSARVSPWRGRTNPGLVAGLSSTKIPKFRGECDEWHQIEFQVKDSGFLYTKRTSSMTNSFKQAPLHIIPLYN
jgi:hypothetical protein